MKQNKIWIALITVLIAIFSIPITVSAGVWKNEDQLDQGDWWYDNEDGTYAKAGWYWIDGNNDKVEECYYFDEKGWLLTDTITPDGYQVNSSGQWVINGEVKLKEKINDNAIVNDEKKNTKIKSIGLLTIGRPSWIGVPNAYARKEQLRTIKNLKQETDLIPTYLYNEKGYLIESYDYVSRVTYDVRGENPTMWELKYNRWFYSYDGNGRIIRKWQLESDFEGIPTDEDDHWSYEYDSKGYLIKEIHYVNERGTWYMHTQNNYYYDGDGRLIKAIIKNAMSAPKTGRTLISTFNGEMVVEEIIYDDINRTIKSYITYDGKGMSKAGTFPGVTCKVNEKGDIIESVHDVGSSIFEYDIDGRLIRSYIKNEKGEIYSDYQYIYE